MTSSQSKAVQLDLASDTRPNDQNPCCRDSGEFRCRNCERLLCTEHFERCSRCANILCPTCVSPTLLARHGQCRFGCRSGKKEFQMFLNNVDGLIQDSIKLDPGLKTVGEQYRQNLLSFLASRGLI